MAFDYDGRPFVMGGAFNGTALDTTEIMRMSLVGKQTWTNGTEVGLYVDCFKSLNSNSVISVQ